MVSHSEEFLGCENIQLGAERLEFRLSDGFGWLQWKRGAAAMRLMCC
jgi:hypothetical protein